MSRTMRRAEGVRNAVSGDGCTRRVRKETTANMLIFMVPTPRLERGTPRSTIWCSNQLSYVGTLLGNYPSPVRNASPPCSRRGGFPEWGGECHGPVVRAFRRAHGHQPRERRGGEPADRADVARHGPALRRGEGDRAAARLRP